MSALGQKQTSQGISFCQQNRRFADRGLGSSARVSQAMIDRCRPIILAELIWQAGAGYKG
jgi:hypothetical protein